jgi:hypothetical protein
VVRPLTPKAGAGDFALVAGHRLTAISLLTGRIGLLIPGHISKLRTDKSLRRYGDKERIQSPGSLRKCSADYGEVSHNVPDIAYDIHR